MVLALNGIGVSRGVAIGKAHILQRGQPEVVEYAIPEQYIDSEIDRFTHALDIARGQLKNIRTRIPESASADIAAFIDTHLLMLNDPALTSIPADLIRDKQCNAEWALKLQRESLVNIFEEMDDAYLRTRKDDVVHVVNRILRILLKEDTHLHDDKTPLKDSIIIADDLTPADTVLLQHQGISAFITEFGGPLSHTAIMARSLQIPSIAGAHNARRYLQDDELVIIDGQNGIIIANPDTQTLSYYHQRQQEEKLYFESLADLKEDPSVTVDGYAITLHANIELPEDIEAVNNVCAAGVGLFRTEFLFMNRDKLPNEDEQLHAYINVLNSLNGRPITIRTLDLGADKPANSNQASPIPANPALGLRAIRLCLKDPSLFRPQLRAILRASAHGPVRLMIPMLSNTQELFQVLHIINTTKTELANEGLKFDEDMPIGGMIEIPAAAIQAYAYAKHLDFLSIGTNDLIQYTLAIDRIDDEVNYLYDPLHPAVLRLIHHIIKAGNKAGIPVSMCGEMAGDSKYTRLLLGLGLREFSMQPSTLLEVKNITNQSDIKSLIRPARNILKCLHSQEAHSIVQQLNDL